MILFTTSAVAEIAASLEVVSGQDAAGGPYRRAELTVTNSAAAPVETVLLKPVGIGLTVRYKLTVPPGSDGKQVVFLPAISPAQEYALTALDASGEVVGLASASITWPAELVTDDAFIDDAFRAWTDDPARWPAKKRWNYLLVLAMFVTAAAATLLIRRTLLRVGAVVILAATVTAMIVYVFIPAGPETVQVHRYFLTLHDSVSRIDDDSFAVISAKRTTQWSHAAYPLSHPVYPDHEAAAQDDTVVEPPDGAIYLTLNPGQVRVIRPAWEMGLHRFTPITPQWRHGKIRREVDGFTVEADFIRRGSLLIRNDSVWLLGQDAGGQKVFLRNDRAQSYWAFMSGKGGRNLNRHARRLLNYWRNKHQQGGQAYMIELSGIIEVGLVIGNGTTITQREITEQDASENGTGIVVVRLKEVSSGATTTSAPVKD